MKSIFEQIGGTYTVQGDYRLPNLTLPAEDERPIGVWGQRRLRYLKQHHKVLYYNLLTSGKLHSHLADTEEQAQALFSRLVKEYAEKEGVTEQLKATDQMAWVRQMNNIRNRATNVASKYLTRFYSEVFAPMGITYEYRKTAAARMIMLALNDGADGNDGLSGTERLASLKAKNDGISSLPDSPSQSSFASWEEVDDDEGLPF